MKITIGCPIERTSVVKWYVNACIGSRFDFRMFSAARVGPNNHLLNAMMLPKIVMPPIKRVAIPPRNFTNSVLVEGCGFCVKTLNTPRLTSSAPDRASRRKRNVSGATRSGSRSRSR